MNSNSVAFIKSSYADFDGRTIAAYIHGLLLKDLPCEYDFEFLDALNDYLAPLQVKVEEYYDADDAYRWVSKYIQYAATSSYGEIIVYIDAESAAENWQEDYTFSKKEFVDSLSNIIVHEMVHRWQNEKYQRWDNNDPSVIGEFEYLKDSDEISAHAIQAVEEALSMGYSEDRILEKLKSSDNEILKELDATFPYVEYFEGEPELRKLRKEMADYILNYK